MELVGAFEGFAQVPEGPGAPALAAAPAPVAPHSEGVATVTQRLRALDAAMDRRRSAALGALREELRAGPAGVFADAAAVDTLCVASQRVRAALDDVLACKADVVSKLQLSSDERCCVAADEAGRAALRALTGPLGEEASVREAAGIRAARTRAGAEEARAPVTSDSLARELTRLAITMSTLDAQEAHLAADGQRIDALLLKEAGEKAAAKPQSQSHAQAWTLASEPELARRMRM